MFFRPSSDPAPESPRWPALAPSLETSRAEYLLPISGFRLGVVAGADDVLRLEVRDSDGAQLVELSESPEPAGTLGNGWRGSTAGTGTWAVAVGVVVPELTYLTFLAGRRARASSRLSMAPTRIGPFWYAESDVSATRMDVVVAGRSTGEQPLRSWTRARS
jgi:hypothetical protein